MALQSSEESEDGAEQGQSILPEGKIKLQKTDAEEKAEKDGKNMNTIASGLAGEQANVQKEMSALLAREEPESVDGEPKLPDAKNLIDELKKFSAEEQKKLTDKLEKSTRVYQFKNGKRVYVNLKITQENNEWKIQKITYDKNGTAQPPTAVSNPEKIKLREWKKVPDEKLPLPDTGTVPFRTDEGKMVMATIGIETDTGWTLVYKIAGKEYFCSSDELRKYENNDKVAYARRQPERTIPTNVPSSEPATAKVPKPQSNAAAAAPAPAPKTTAETPAQPAATAAEPESAAQSGEVPAKTKGAVSSAPAAATPEARDEIIDSKTIDKIAEEAGTTKDIVEKVLAAAKKVGVAPAAATPAAPGAQKTEAPAAQLQPMYKRLWQKVTDLFEKVKGWFTRERKAENKEEEGEEEAPTTSKTPAAPPTKKVKTPAVTQTTTLESGTAALKAKTAAPETKGETSEQRQARWRKDFSTIADKLIAIAYPKDGTINEKDIESIGREFKKSLEGDEQADSSLRQKLATELQRTDIAGTMWKQLLVAHLRGIVSKYEKVKKQESERQKTKERNDKINQAHSDFKTKVLDTALGAGAINTGHKETMEKILKDIDSATQAEVAGNMLKILNGAKTKEGKPLTDGFDIKNWLKSEYIDKKK